MWYSLSKRARRVYSQTGEEGILEAVFEIVGTPTKFLVDIGAGDGVQLSNTKLFLERGWRGARFDVVARNDVHNVRITADNVCSTLRQHGVPANFDLLSIDIDGIDWYVLRSILREFTPRVFVCEINNSKPADPPITIEYNESHVFDSTDYFGASLSAYRMLAEARGYKLVHCQPYNAFFVRGEFIDKPPNVNWAPRAYFKRDTTRPWKTITESDVA